MGKRSLAAISALIFLCPLNLAFTGCEELGDMLALGARGVKESVMYAGIAIDNAADARRIAAEEKWRTDLVEQGKKNPSLWKDNLRKIVAKDLAERECDYQDDVCIETYYTLLYTPQKFDLMKFVRRYEKENGPNIYVDGTLFRYVSTSENVDKVMAGKLGMRPIGTANVYRQTILRAALLRRALIEYPLHLADGVQARPTPDPDRKRMADRLLELDMSIMGCHRSYRENMYMGMDYELMASLGPESEFNSYVNQAREMYLSAIQDTWEVSITALLHYDRLTQDEKQRVAAVRLFIKNVPNRYIDDNVPIPFVEHRGDYSGAWHYDDVYFGSTKYLDIPYFWRLWVIGKKGYVIQPSNWDYLRIQWRQDWGRQLNELLQQNGKNQEISALLARAYPTLTEDKD